MYTVINRKLFEKEREGEIAKEMWRVEREERCW